MKHFKLKTFFYLLAILVAKVSVGQTVHIGGTSYETINDAILAATSGDVIDITGIHTEIISFNDKSITLRGTDPSVDIIQAAASAGTASDRVITISTPASPIDVTIENLGIRYGNAAANGGAIFLEKNTGLTTLKNLRIYENTATTNGGGVAVAGSNVDIIECTIENNFATTDGGGLILAPNNGSLADNAVLIQKSLINSNSGNNGGGIYINGNKQFGNDYRLNVEIENTTISNNTARSGTSAAGGGGIWSKCAFWTTNAGGDGTTGNVTLRLVHSTLYNNTHSAALKAGIQFTSDPAGAFTNFSIYNSIVVSQDDVAIKALNFANTNTTNVVNCILGGLNAPPSTFIDDVAKNNSVGKTATFAGINPSLVEAGGNVQVLGLSALGAAVNYCTATTGLTLPQTDARNQTRDATADAGAFEFVNTPPVLANELADLNLTAGFASFEVNLAETFSDSDGDILSLLAESSEEGVATVALNDNILTITEVATGSTVITITASDNSGGEVVTNFTVNVAPTTGNTVSIGENYYLTISLAVEAAEDGAVIDIAGIHTESVSFNNKSLTLRGTDPSLDIIQASESAGMAAGRVLSFVDAPSAINITVENLGIRYGQSSENGGGILVDKILGKLTLRNLRIAENATAKNGGGVSISGSDVDIIACSIINNTATLDGGGIIVATNNAVTTNTILTIHGSLIDSNVSANGGGIYLNGNKDFGDDHLLETYIENTTISNNSATSGTAAAGGGAIWSKCALWTEDNLTGNVSLTMVHTTLYGNTHTALNKYGIQFTSVPAGALTNFSIYNSIVVSQDDLTQKALNFANSNTLDVVNCILGGLNGAPTAIVDDVAKNNTKGQTASFAGIATSLSDEGGNVQVLALSQGANAVDYCTAATGITLPTVDARGRDRDALPDAGSYELILTNANPIVANGIQNQLLQAGFGTSNLSLASVFSDADDDILQYTQDVDDETVVTVSFEGNTLIITEVGAGSTTVTVTADDGNGGSVSDEFTVTVNAAPVVANVVADQTYAQGFANATIDLSTTFSDPDANTLMLSVSVVNQTVVSASVSGTTLTITEEGIGSTTVTVTANDGNGGSITESFMVTVNEVTLSTKDKNEDVKVYPNPASSYLNVALTNQKAIQNIYVVDVAGKSQIVQTKVSLGQAEVDVNHLQSGYYFLILRVEGEESVYRFLKK